MERNGNAHTAKSQDTQHSPTSHRSPFVIQVSNANSPFTGNLATTASSNGAGNSSAPSFQSLLSQLTNYVNAPPAQRMEASILAQLGITLQQLASMSPQDRAKVEKEVTDLMKKEMQAQQQQQQLQAQIQQPASQSKTPSLSAINLAI